MSFADKINSLSKRHKITTSGDDIVELNTKLVEGKDDLFQRIVSKGSDYDILMEYFLFRKLLPKLLKCQEQELINIVEKELNIKTVMSRLNLETLKFEYMGNKFPILDALSYKIGIHVRNILAPPTTFCLLCNKTLWTNKQPITVPLHTVSGPELATKYTWRCRNCTGAFRLMPNKSKISFAQQVYYYPDKYGNPDYGYRRYSKELNVSIFQGSDEVFFTSRLIESYSSELQHCWTSIEGKAEAYNETFREELK